nr:MAG TPA: hypothetical protein [Caudoviricetes sp.]
MKPHFLPELIYLNQRFSITKFVLPYGVSSCPIVSYPVLSYIL